MILSSVDILSVLGSSEIIRLSARISIVDSKPVLSGAEGLFIYVNRFPSLHEFEATWTLWIESDGSEPDDLVISEISRLLPSVKISHGLLTTLTTTDFRTENTQRAPEAPKARKASMDLSAFEERFQELSEELQDRMLLVHSGRPGIDGRDGLDGRDGADGRDAELGEVDLFSLADCHRGIPLQKGQVLMWDGSGWTNLYVPRLETIFAGGGSGSGDGEGVIIADSAPGERDDGSELQDGDQWWQSTTGVMYIWYVDSDNGQWVQSSSGEGGGGGSSTLAGLLDTETAGVEDGDVLVYRSLTGNWTAENPPPTGLQSGDNISELTNDAGYITAAEVPQVDVTEAPQDGKYYVRQNAQWIELAIALSSLGVPVEEPLDGGNFTTGFTAATTSTVIDGGNLTTGYSEAISNETVDGGNYTTG